MHTKVWSENLEGRDQVGDLGVVVSITLKWSLKKEDVRI
jgi:hypothetical protein